MKSNQIKTLILSLFASTILVVFSHMNVAQAKTPCQVEPCLGQPSIPLPFSKKPHPKWENFWKEFGEGFREGFGLITAPNNVGNNHFDKPIKSYIKRSRLDLKKVDHILKQSKRVIRSHPGRITHEDLIKIFGDRRFAEEINRMLPKRGPGRILGIIVGRIVRIILEGALNP